MALLVAILLALLLGCSRAGPERGITVRFLDRPDRNQAWADAIRAFQAAHPDIRVELVEGPSATNAREDLYATSLLAGDPIYDLVFMDIVWLPKFAAAGWLLPLDARLAAGEQADFLPGDLEGSRFRGRLYRVPMRTDAGLLFYRRDLLVARALAPPRTWEALVEEARALQAPPELWGYVFQGKQYEGLVVNFLELVWSAGGDVLDSQGRVILDQPEAIAALRWLRDAIVRHRITPPAVATYEEQDSANVFLQGRSLFLRNWPYVWALTAESPRVRGRVAITALPGRADAVGISALGGWGFGVSRFSRHPEAAWAFARYATSAEGQKRYALRAGTVPARRALLHDAELVARNPHYPVLAKVLERARPRPVHPKYAQISDILQHHVSAALVGRTEPQDALRAAARELRTLLASPRTP